MEAEVLDPNNIKGFNRLDGIEVSTATPSTKFIENVKRHTKMGYKPMHEHEWFGKVKGNNHPIALVGGGPSVKKELDNLKEFQAAGFPVVACGSSHDYLVEQGIIPDFCTLCDPDPITGAYITKHNDKTVYLIALSCDSSVFDLLKDRKFYVWNCRSDEAAEAVKDDIINQVDVVGGCTVGLRTVSIAMCFGFNNIHLWGFDSCMGSGDAHHAYEFATDQETVGVVYPVRFGDHKDNEPDKEGKYYMCSGYQLAQAIHFQQFLISFGVAFTPTFHGEGMLPDFMAYLRRKAEENNINVYDVKAA